MGKNHAYKSMQRAKVGSASGSPDEIEDGIVSDEYHSSKRPLLQRLAVQGVEIDCKDVIIGDPTAAREEEWSVIELRDKESPATTESSEIGMLLLFA